MCQNIACIYSDPNLLLVLRRFHSYCFQGRYENLAGKVSGIDGDADRWLIQLTGKDKRVVSICGVSLDVVTEQQYKTAGKVLNAEEYQKFKVIGEERLAKVRMDIKELEESADNRRSGSSSVREEKERTRRRERDDSSRKNRKSDPDGRKDKERRKRSRSKS